MQMGKCFTIMLCALLLANSSAFAESVFGGDRDSGYRTAPAPKAPCLRWFLFFCISRENTGYTPASYEQPEAGRPFEPAMTQHIPAGSAPILGPFNQAFKTCCPGGSYTSLGIWGDKRHQVRRSCHNSGSAIDISAVRCQGYSARAGQAGFRRFVSCMQGRNGLHTIYGHGDHKGHVDIALRSCQIGGVGKIRTR